MSVSTHSISLIFLSALVSNPLWAADSGEQPLSPQSTEAMQKMADELEADRKAREKENQEKREAAEQAQTTGQADQDTGQVEVEGVADPINRNRPLLNNRPKPTPRPIR